MPDDITPAPLADITIEELDEVAGGTSVACIGTVACPVSTLATLQPDTAE